MFVIPACRESIFFYMSEERFRTPKKRLPEELMLRDPDKSGSPHIYDRQALNRMVQGKPVYPDGVGE